MSLPSQIVSMSTFQRMLQVLSANVTIVVRGRHAVGKSEGVYQGAALRRSEFYRDPENCRKLVALFGGSVPYLRAKNRVTEWNYDMGLPVIERRLSQLTEGDIVGLPVLNPNSESTQFKPCDWLINACHFPVVLFLDERNRALEGVKQAVFQLADSKAFYGNTLHDETMITVAENIGDQYTVQQSDPAEISRGAVITLEPSQEEFLDYISTFVHPAMVEFLRTNPRAIEHVGNFEPNKKYPDRRSWVALDNELTRLDLYNNPEDKIFYSLAGAFCGTDFSHSFYDFCKNRERQVSAEDIIGHWDTAKARLIKESGKDATVSNETYVELAAKLKDYLTDAKLSPEDAVELARFIFDAPSEVRVMLYTCLSEGPSQNLLAVHKYTIDLIVATTTGNTNPDKPLVPPVSLRDRPPAKTRKASSSGDENKPKPRTRGSRT